MVLIDTHNHLDFPGFDQERSTILRQSRQAGVVRQILIGVYRAQWAEMLALCDSEPDLYAAPGLHPLYLKHHRDGDLEQLAELLMRRHNDSRLCAVGEIGLDYYHYQGSSYQEGSDRDAQKRLFSAQLELCCRTDLPALLHVRRAHADTIALLKQYRLPRGGIVHAFGGSLEEAREYLRLGFKIGLGGAGTWPQAHRMHRVLKALPLDAIVLETDAPDIPPASHPQGPNSPAYLPDICRALAKIRGIASEELAQITTRNTCSLFHWSVGEPLTLSTRD